MPYHENNEDFNPPIPAEILEIKRGDAYYKRREEFERRRVWVYRLRYKEDGWYYARTNFKKDMTYRNVFAYVKLRFF